MKPKFEAIPTSPIFEARTLLENTAHQYGLTVQRIGDAPNHELHCHIIDKQGMWLMKSEQQPVITAFKTLLADHGVRVMVSEERRGMIDSIVIRMDNTDHNEVVSE